MTKGIIYVGCVFLLLSCHDSEIHDSNNATINETVPQDQRGKQLSRPSSGAFAPLNLGKVTCKIGEFERTIIDFKSGYNDLTITDDGITIRITDMNGHSLLIVLRGEDVIKDARRSYTSILKDAQAPDNALVNLVSEDHNMNWKEGTLEVTELNAKNGKFVASLHGKGVPPRAIDQDAEDDFILTIDMRFENIMNHATRAVQ
jgi:hypothetical protein